MCPSTAELGLHRAPPHQEHGDTGPSAGDRGCPNIVGESLKIIRPRQRAPTETPGLVVSWNAGAESVKGYTEDEILGRHYSVFYPADEAAAGVPDEHLAKAAREGRAEYEGWRVRKDGSQFWASVVSTVIKDDDGTLRGFGKVTRDLTERHATEQENLRRSLHDDLTGLPNRALLGDRLDQALSRLERRGSCLAVLFIDLNERNSQDLWIGVSRDLLITS
jgi:PAS domain S-box-containing protein